MIEVTWAVLGLVVGVLIIESAAGRLRVPAPIVLLVAGVGASLVPGVPAYDVDPEFVLFVLLPPLLYAAALESSALAMRKLWRPVVGLAVGLVVVTTVAVGLVLHWLVPAVPLPAAFALGAIVAPPDAVAATAIARRVGLSRRIVTVLEGESLFDDAASLVLLKVSVAGIAAGTIEWVPAVGDFAWATVGGLGIGVVAGFAISGARRFANATMSVTTLSLCAPFASFLAAEEVHASGVLACVVCGLIVGHRRSVDVSAEARLTENAIWGSLQFLLEGIVFALIGLELLDIIDTLSASGQDVALALVGVLAIVLIVRPIWLFAGYLTQPYVRLVRPKLSARETAVLSWAGMRGVVSLAAAQTLPAHTPMRSLLLVCALGVILATLVVQGLTLPAVIRKVRAPRRDPMEHVRARDAAQERATLAVVARIDARADREDLSVEMAEHLRELAQMREWRSEARDESGPGLGVGRRRLAIRRIIDLERESLLAQRSRGQLSDHVLRDMEVDLDLEEALFSRDPSVSMSGHLDPLHPGTVDDDAPGADPEQAVRTAR